MTIKQKPLKNDRLGLSVRWLLATLALFGATVYASSSEDFHADIPVFTEEALPAQIEHRYGGAWEYFVGGGVSAFDCNQDRFPDLVFAGGSEPSALFVNTSKTGESLRFKRSALLGKLPGPANVTGTYVLDIDNDGHLDLVLLRVGQNMLLRGLGDCQFELANALFNFVDGHQWSTAFSAVFEAGRAYPTLAFGHYVDRAAPGSPWGTCADNTLFRTQESNQSAMPSYQQAITLSPGYCALSLLFTDWNKSGVDALRISNDRQYYRGGQEQMWRLDQGRLPREYRAADGWRRLIIWGMGIAEGDVDGDGYPEYALTSMGDTKFQQLDKTAFAEQGAPIYDDIAFAVGATAHRPYSGEDLNPSTGWHAEFADFNNDARLDLFIAKGNVEQMPDFAAFDPDNLLLQKHDGSFSEMGDQAGIALDRRGRGAAVVDLNLDGLLDLVVVNREENISLFRQTGVRHADHLVAGGNWLQIELRQPGVNQRAVGATVSIKTGNHNQTRRIRVGGGHASGSSGFIHVGLGVAERAQIRIRWPDGRWSATYQAFANQFMLIEKNRQQAKLWYPPIP